ncbi:MAG: M23 family metallopeptidase [Peptococcaceae bacterium]|nr:M23 family metallopeptidase [Peptococcaceae bacterium]
MNFFAKPFRVFACLALGIGLLCAVVHEQRARQEQQAAYRYLGSLPPELVLECRAAGLQIAPDAWIDLLAIRSTVATAAESEGEHGWQAVLAGEGWESARSLFSDGEAQRLEERRRFLAKYPLFQSGRFSFPVQGNPWYVDTYGADREGGSRKHEGTDLFSPEGTPVINVAAGKVERLGWNRLGGERVGVRGDDGVYYYYAHLKEINPSLKIGQKIERNAWIGGVGHTGDAITTPDHLHFGMQLPDGEWLNPYAFLVVWEHDQQVGNEKFQQNF